MGLSGTDRTEDASGRPARRFGEEGAAPASPKKEYICAYGGDVKKETGPVPGIEARTRLYLFDIEHLIGPPGDF
jgi:hypothetical protein